MAEQKDTLAELRRRAESATFLVLGRTTVLKLLDVVDAAKEFELAVLDGSEIDRRPELSAAQGRLREALAALEGDEGRGGR